MWWWKQMLQSAAQGPPFLLAPHTLCLWLSHSNTGFRDWETEAKEISQQVGRAEVTCSTSKRCSHTQLFSTSCPPSCARVGLPVPVAAWKLAGLWATGIHGTSWPSSLFMFHFSQCSSLHRGIWKSPRHWLSFFTHISLSVELFSKEVRSYIIYIIWSVILLFCP